MTKSSSRMVATSHPVAVEAAVTTWDRGGNAVDAAVAAAAMLTVVDPRSTGIGGDLFAQVWPKNAQRPHALAAAGPAPLGLSLDALKAAGFEAMPTAGAWAITVPGSVAGWEEINKRHGKLDLATILQPAVDVAIKGATLTRFVADEWATCFAKLQGNRAAAELFLPEGRYPVVGERFANPQLAEVLRRIGAEGSEFFYRGDVAEAIATAVQELGGPLNIDDLASWGGPEWSEPITSRYREVDVFELPPPGHGLITLEALGIYERIEATTSVDVEHAAIESMKLAFSDAHRYVADPRFHAVPVEEILSSAYLKRRRSEIDMKTAHEAAPGVPTDTVYVATADEDSACSLIQSVYEGFGSGVVVPGTGMALQNRGAGFVMDAGHVNRPEPGKRPYHTIIPAMLGNDAGFLGCLGVVGGFMQPQGQFQIIRNLFDRGMSARDAMNAPRFRYVAGKKVSFESGFDEAVVAALEHRGHEVSELSRFEAGGGQLILRTEEGFVGASDPRKDGMASAG